ncbi:FAD-binding oxidoreductase [Neobacillus muris]|uniref:FAD-binding oxidoreductase n=1 Tax=Neobacillus muris TaxID=2941334 RepID=UPI002041933F|nr:FAD-linked oxidase C-terminal domain-containing protein [Neobacillus muris]
MVLVTESLVRDLTEILSEQQVTANLTILEQHGKDESYHRPHLPDVVVFPANTEEVSRILKYANEHEVPIIPFGLGSSVEGQVIPYQGGISIDFQLMNKILEVRPSDFLVRVQPGVSRTQLNKELKKYGLFFSVDPGADATLGGMTATNASGTTSVKYGVMRDQVRDLEVVLADGRIIHTGNLSAKSSSGYHLTGLFVGSEGTLGVFTEMTLRVYGIPESIVSGRAVFPTMEAAVTTVNDFLSAGIPVARVEFVDAHSISQFNLYNQTEYPEQPTLFIEFHGNEEGLQNDVRFAKRLAQDNHCSDFVIENDSKKRAQLWEARHQLAYAFIHLSGGKKMMVTDVVVPLSELVGAVQHARKVIDETGLNGGILGHVGDGNYHVILMINPGDPNELAKAEKINAQLVDYALKRGGTCTGEHGVGVGKAKYQLKEHGPALDIMKAFKQTIDPKGILNPGKIFL